MEYIERELLLPGDNGKKKMFSGKKRLILFIFFLIFIVGLIFTAYYLGRCSIEESKNILRVEGEYTFLDTYPTRGDDSLLINEERDKELTIQEIYKRVNPAVVTVMVDLKDDLSVGTGIVFTEDGYILTNAHVIEGGLTCRVCLSDDRFYDALLVGYDQTQDLAVLKVEVEDLPVAEFGDSNTLTVGDSVYAIGNPLGVELRGTLTDGIVSAINRDVEIVDKTVRLIQTNAALNEGNSGGPLINVYGQVIGINTIKMNSNYLTETEGLGFAIPITSVACIVDELIQYGEVQEEPVRWSTWSLFGDGED